LQVSYCGVHRTIVLCILMASVILWCSEDDCTFYPDCKCHIVVFTWLLYFLSWWEMSYCGVHRTTELFILIASVILWCSQEYCTFYPDGKCHIVVFTGLLYFLSWCQVSYCGVHWTTVLFILMARQCHIVVFTGLLCFLSWWQVS